MTLPVWPAGLPPLIGLVSALGSSQLYEPPRETAMDDGPVRTRRQKLFVEVPRSIVLVLTRAQFATFYDFVAQILNAGAGRFRAPVRTRTGAIAERTCRIQGAPAEKDNGATSTVSFTLMVKDF